MLLRYPCDEPLDGLLFEEEIDREILSRQFYFSEGGVNGAVAYLVEHHCWAVLAALQLRYQVMLVYGSAGDKLPAA